MSQNADAERFDSSRYRAAELRLGGGLVLLGTVAWLVLTVAHGDLPGTGQGVMEHVNPTLWRLVHILTILTSLVITGGFALLVRTFAVPTAAALGRVGAVFLIVATAVLGVDFAIDGFVLSTLVENWQAASSQAARETYVAQADFVLTIMGGTSLSYQTLFGTATATLAGATLVSKAYPRWVCWIGLAGGAYWGIVGVLLFSQMPGVEFWFIFLAVVPVNVWMLGIGWLSWRRGRAALGDLDATGARPTGNEDRG